MVPGPPHRKDDSFSCPLGGKAEMTLVAGLEDLIRYTRMHIRSSSYASAYSRLKRTVPVKGFVDLLVSKMLSSCMRYSNRVKDSTPSSDSVLGKRAKQILVEINKRYPHELQTAVHKYMETAKMRTTKEGTLLEIICKMLDGNEVSSAAVSDSKIWLTIDHPKVDVRRAALSGLTKSAIVEAQKSDSQSLVMVQDAVLRQLHDDDLTVVKAALSIDGLSDIIKAADLFEALHDALTRCVTFLKGASHGTSVAIGTAHLVMQSCGQFGKKEIRDVFRVRKDPWRRLVNW